MNQSNNSVKFYGHYRCPICETKHNTPGAALDCIQTHLKWKIGVYFVVLYTGDLIKLHSWKVRINKAGVRMLIYVFRKSRLGRMVNIERTEEEVTNLLEEGWWEEMKKPDEDA